MNRYRKWAGRSLDRGDISAIRRSKSSAQQSSQIIAPNGRPVGQMAPMITHPANQSQILTPAPAPAPFQLAGAPRPTGGFEGYKPPKPTNFIVKLDSQHGDPWEECLATIPDIAEAAGVLEPEVDAMDLAGLPAGVPLPEKWTHGAQYYNGVSDSTAKGRLDQAFAKHGQSSGQVRTSEGMGYQGTPQGTFSPLKWSPG